MNEDFGFLQEGDYLSVITDKKRTFYPVIIVKSNELVLYIYEGLLREEVKNGEIIFTRLTVCPLDWEGRYPF